MSYDKVLKVRLSDVQLKRLGELSLGIEGGMSGVVRSWIDSSLVDISVPVGNVSKASVNVVKKDDIRVPLVDDSDEKRLTAERLQKMVDGFKAKGKK